MRVEKRSFTVNEWNKVEFQFEIVEAAYDGDNAHLVDTNAIIEVLHSFRSYRSRLLKTKRVFYVLLNTVDEILEQYDLELLHNGAGAVGYVLETLHNFRKILALDCMRVLAVPGEKCNEYAQYGKDSCFVAAAESSRFGKIVTQDPVLRKLFRDRVIHPHDFLGFIG